MAAPDRGSWLLIGCGYVGRRVLALLGASGAQVVVVTRDPARAAAFTAVGATRACVGEYADAAFLEASCASLPAPLRVLCLLPPSACADERGELQPLQRLVAALGAMAPTRAILTSSTGVYGEQGGGIVAAETPCRPQSPREQRLAGIERCWLGAGPAHQVLRYAGLYGPGRVIGLAGLRHGAPVAGGPDGWLNLLHVDDAAALLIRMALADAAAVELGADGTPVTRRTYYRALAALAGAPAPVFDGGAATRGGGARRCVPASTCERLAWRPMYRDFRAGLVRCNEVFEG